MSLPVNTLVNDRTPLMLAIEHNPNPAIVCLISQHPSCDLMVTTSDGRTALDFAKAYKGDPEIRKDYINWTTPVIEIDLNKPCLSRGERIRQMQQIINN